MLWYHIFLILLTSVINVKTCQNAEALDCFHNYGWSYTSQRWEFRHLQEPNWRSSTSSSFKFFQERSPNNRGQFPKLRTHEHPVVSCEQLLLFHDHIHGLFFFFSQVSSATTLSSHSPSSYSRTDEKSFSRNDVFRLYQTAPKRESSYNFRMSREQFAESINTRNRSRQMDARPDKWKYQPRAMRDLPAVPQIRPSGLPKIKAPSGNEYIIRTYIAHGSKWN